MNADDLIMRRFRRIKRGLYLLVALFLVVREVYYQFVRDVPLVESLIDWLIGVFFAAILIEISFRAVESYFRRLQQEIIDRQRVEDALRESEKKFRTLAEQSPDMIFINKGGRVVYVNESSEKALGYTAEEFCAADFDFLSLIAPKDRDTVKGSFAKHTRGEEVEPYEYSLVTQEGGSIEVILATRPIDYEGEMAILGTITDITERKRAEEEIRRRTAQLEALRQLGLEIAAQLDLDALLHSVALLAVQLLDGTSGGLYLYRPEQDLLEWTVAVGPGSAPTGSTLRRGEGLSGKVWETNEPLIVNDYQHWEGQAAVYDSYPITAVLGVPICWGEKFLGVLDVLRDAPSTFSPADAEILNLFARQASIAIENARLYRDAQQRAAELEILRRTSLQLTSSLDLSTVLDGVVESALTLVDATDCHIYLYDEASEAFTFGAALWDDGRREPAVKAVRRSGLTATVARGGEPVIINDASSHPLYATPESLKWDVQAVAGFPLKRAGRVMGVFTIAFVDPHTFSVDELRVLGLLADQAAIAIENAWLLQTKQAQWELGEALATAAAVVNSTLNIEQVLDRILAQVERVVFGDTFNVMLVEGDQARIVRWRGYERVGITEPPGDSAISITDYPNLINMAQTGESVVVPDTTASPDWIPHGDREWRRSYVGAPIRVADAVVGFLNVNGTQAGQFGPADAERLSIFANYAATAIENARLVESLEDQVAARTAEIRAEQEKSETILRSVGDAITMADLQMRVQYVNDAFTALTGYTAEEVLGKQVSRVGAVVKSEQARQSLWSDLAQGKSWQGEAIGYRKDGRTYDAELTVAPVLDPDGSLVGCVSSHRDVSQQKELERTRSRFMTHVSHELRTPVTNIKLYTQLLQRGLSPEKTERHLRVLGKQVDRLGHLVEDILEMTGLDSGQTVIARNSVSLPTIIQDTLVRFQERARAAGLSLVSQPLPADLPAVTGDQVWLGRALSRLVENVVTFVPMQDRDGKPAPMQDRDGEPAPMQDRDGKPAPMQDRDGKPAPSGRPVNIEVGTAEQDGRTWVTIAVQDAGPGISAEEQEQILDRFFRGNLAESGHVPGTGLGLSIVQEILRAHGGRVAVESEVGVGSTFTLWLPGVRHESSDGLDSAGVG